MNTTVGAKESRIGRIRSRLCRTGHALKLGYEIPREQITFAHRLVDEGFDIVHGHSSHHIKAIEVYHGHLILYGCGDLITDYEGITGYEEFRSSLALMYFPRLSSLDGRLLSVRLVPMRMRRLRLQRASTEDALWICELLSRLGLPFHTRVELGSDNSMSLL